MRLRVRGTGAVIEAQVRYRNMGIEDDCWVWVLEVPVNGQDVPIKPPANGYEIVEASHEERDRLEAGDYTGLFA